MIRGAPNDDASRLLVGVTDSPHAPAVIRAGGTLGSALCAEQWFIHVGRDNEDSRRRLSLVFANANAPMPTDTLLVRDGRPDQVMCEAAVERDAGLIVIGALEQENVVRELIGSTARRIARRAGCSVFLTLGKVDENAPWRNLVASVRFDQASAELAAWIAKLARATAGTRVHMIHEYGGDAFDEIEGGQMNAAEYRKLRLAAENYEFANFLDAFDFGEASVSTTCLTGRAGMELVYYALEVGADLLATTAPDHPLGVWDRFFGHPAETVLQRLPCSLLIYRRRKRL